MASSKQSSEPRRALSAIRRSNRGKRSVGNGASLIHQHESEVGVDKPHIKSQQIRKVNTRRSKTAEGEELIPQNQPSSLSSQQIPPYRSSEAFSQYDIIQPHASYHASYISAPPPSYEQSIHISEEQQQQQQSLEYIFNNSIIVEQQQHHHNQQQQQQQNLFPPYSQILPIRPVGRHAIFQPSPFDLQSTQPPVHSVSSQQIPRITPVDYPSAIDNNVSSAIQSQRQTSSSPQGIHNHHSHSDQPAPPSAPSSSSSSSSPVIPSASWNFQCTIGQYVLNKRIGQGSYGVVWEAFDGYTGAKVAIKAISINSDAFRAKRLAREIRTLRHLRSHPNIITLLDVLVGENANTIYLIFEFAATDLYRLQCSNVFLTEDEVARAMFQLLTGIAGIHSCAVIHRDLKPANILISDEGFLKICDFGLARGLGTKALLQQFGISSTSDSSSSFSSVGAEIQIQGPMSPIHPQHRHKQHHQQQQQNQPSRPSHHRRQLTMHVVTRWYRPPEVILLAEHYDCSVDMWSLGCIMADMLCMVKENVSCMSDRRPIFPGNTCFPLTAEDGKDWENSFDQLNVIFNIIGTPDAEDISEMNHEKAEAYLRSLPRKQPQDLSQIFTSASADALDLLRKLLSFNPRKRPTPEQCLNHPFLQKIKESWSHLTAINSTFKPIQFEFEDYEIGIEELKRIIIDEAKSFHEDTSSWYVV